MLLRPITSYIYLLVLRSDANRSCLASIYIILSSEESAFVLTHRGFCSTVSMPQLSPHSATVPFRIVRQSRVTDPPDGAEIGRLSRVTLALAGCDKKSKKSSDSDGLN